MTQNSPASYALEKDATSAGCSRSIVFYTSNVPVLNAGFWNGCDFLSWRLPFYNNHGRYVSIILIQVQ